MRTKNAMQLKARVNNMAKEAGIPAQAMMQSYLLERLLERLSRSKWRDNVVIKGGVLISSLVGVSSRTTMDLDTTVRGFDLTHESAERAFREIAAVKSDDDWDFEFVRTEDIREALDSTCEKRDSQAAIARWAEVLDDVAGDATMLAQWAKYVRKNPYASGIALQDCCATAKATLASVKG